MSEMPEDTNGGHTAQTGETGLKMPPARLLVAFAVSALFLLCACSIVSIRVGGWVVRTLRNGEPPARTVGMPVLPTWSAVSAELTVAVSPSMAKTLQERADGFNSLALRTPGHETMRITLVEMSPREMVEESLGQPGFQAVAPDSSLWLEFIERRWQELFPSREGSLPSGRVGRSTLFAASPIVIGMRLDAARRLGWPQQAIGWQEVQTRAVAVEEFSWGHPGTDTTAGLAAVLSAFYAGSGTTRGLTAEIAAEAEVLHYVRTVERAALLLGEGDEEGAQRTGGEGSGAAQSGNEISGIPDAVVTQEQSVVAWHYSSRSGRTRLGGRNAAVEPWVAVYPKEGTIWADHPLALLELDGRAGPALTRNQLYTYQAFAGYLLGEESQLALLQAGFRPVDLSIDLGVAPSPFANTELLDRYQPRDLLPLPSSPAVEMALDIWRFAKPPANVILVVDTSESMEGAKLSITKQALHAFVGESQGSQDRIGLLEFGSGVKEFGSLQRLDVEGRAILGESIEKMEAGGYTTLLDAVWAAYEELQRVAEADAVNAIVVMSDGRENDSQLAFHDLERVVGDGQVPVQIHTVAFGSNADSRMLEDLARVGGGIFHRAEAIDIEELYRLIATYF